MAAALIYKGFKYLPKVVKTFAEGITRRSPTGGLQASYTANKKQFNKTFPDTELGFKQAVNWRLSNLDKIAGGKKILTDDVFKDFINKPSIKKLTKKEIAEKLSKNHVSLTRKAIKPETLMSYYVRTGEKAKSKFKNYSIPELKKQLQDKKSLTYTDEKLAGMTDKQIRVAAGDLRYSGRIGAKARAKKNKEAQQRFMQTDKYDTMVAKMHSKQSGRFFGETPTEQVFSQIIRASNAYTKRDGGVPLGTRYEVVGKFPSKKEVIAAGKKDTPRDSLRKLMSKVKIKDNEAVGPYEYITLDNLEDFMIQSSGRGLGRAGENSFTAAIKPFEFREFIKKFKLPDGSRLNARLGRLKGIDRPQTFNVHHYDGGVGKNAYSSQVAHAQANQQLETVLGRGYQNIKNAERGTPGLDDVLRTEGQAIDDFTKQVEKLEAWGGIQTTNQYTKELVGVQPTAETVIKAGYRGLNRSAEKKSIIDAVKNSAIYKKDFEPFGFKDGGNVEKAGVEDAFREHFSLGGLSGDRTNSLGSTGMTNFGGLSQKSNDKVGTIQSLLSGIAAGIIDIPKGAFTLGAALMDLGMGSNNAAKVESFFDDLTTFDEKAEATTVGSLARIFTNLGIPGSQGWKLGKTLARKAIDSKKAGTYFKVSRPDMEGRMQEALTTGGKLLTTAGGAAGIGVADAIFVGDPESVGTLGDAFSVGPTQLDPNSDTDPSREILNRIKFGLDSSLMLGVLAGTGSAMGKVIARNKGLESNNKTLDKLFSKFRPRGDKPQEFFNLERQQIGIRQADVNRATELQRNVDRHIDKIFPFIKGALNRTKTTERADLMKQLNDTLLSGELIDDVAGGLRFTPIDEASRAASINKLKSLGAGKKEIDGIFGAFEDMRSEWGEMFGYLGRKMSADDLASFKTGFGKKFGDYLGSTYEVFKNKSLIPMFNFAPGREAIKKGMNMFKESHAKSKGMTLKEAEAKGLALKDEQAEYYVNQVVESARPPQRLSTKAEQNAGVYFDAPDFFGNKTTLHELDFKGKGLAINDLQPGAKQIVGEILGKVDDPMSTMLAGTGKLSLLTRRNQFFDKLLDESNLAREIDPKTNAKVYPDKKQMFFDDEAAAVEALGNGNVKVVGFDPGGKMQIGNAAHRLNGMFAHKGIVDALSETSTNILGDGMLGKLYTNLILYPKATSQLAKTVLSPITHVRNVVSAGAFATANGIFFPVEGKAMKEAYKALQFGGRTDAAANAMYQKLLKLGVVNTNVRLGDLQRLLTDVKFGEGTSNMTALRGLTKKLSKLKKGAEDLYTAEDDFWKITSWAVERNRYDKAFRKAGLTDFDAYAKTRGFDKYDDFLDETAADIVRNNIPNYDYVNEFVKGLRKLPIGNFVSFPAEIMRTSANILSRGFREITEEITLPDGRKVKPFSGIGYQRLIGFGATTVAVPAAVTETFKMAYNVSEDEMDALRRFVPDWSKNSTLVPIRDDETGNLKYVDFSHANAYDTMIRPFTTILNNVRDGAKDEAPVMESMMRGMFEATKELGSPFISESIWSQAATDIIVRGGRTRTGQRLYTDQTPVGEKVQKIVGHLVEAQLPGSIESFKRLDLAIEPIDIIQRGKFDKYGKTYELGDELAGFVGLRAVEVNPVNAMKFKIADFRTGVNNARREFTQPLLRGGPVTPEQIVDRYQVANEQTYKVQQNMFKDYYAARVLGTGESVLDREFKDRVSNIQLNAIKNAQFRPFIPSENIVKSFAENANALGQRSPYVAAQREIERLLQQYNALPLTLEQFPISVNPFSVAPELPTSGMNLTGGNLPQLNTTLQGSNIGGINNLSNTLAKIEQVDKVFDL